MSTERTRQVARFFGLFMLALQLRILYKLFVAAEVDYDTIAHMTFADIALKMDWLKPSLFTGTWETRYALCFLVLAGLCCIALWGAAALRWSRPGRTQHE